AIAGVQASACFPLDPAAGMVWDGSGSNSWSRQTKVCTPAIARDPHRETEPGSARLPMGRAVALRADRAALLALRVIEAAAVAVAIQAGHILHGLVTGGTRALSIRADLATRTAIGRQPRHRASAYRTCGGVVGAHAAVHAQVDQTRGLLRLRLV